MFKYFKNFRNVHSKTTLKLVKSQFSLNSNSKLDKNDNNYITDFYNKEYTLYDDSNIHKNFFVFSVMTNAPFYALTINLAINGLTDINTDLNRLCLRTIPYMQCIAAGLNYSGIFYKTDQLILKEINNNPNFSPNNFIKKNKFKEIKLPIIISLGSVIISFLSVEKLLNSDILTNHILNTSFTCFCISNCLHLFSYYYGVKPSQNSQYTKYNWLIFVLNIVSYAIIYYFIYNKIRNNQINPLKRKDDLNRIEGLKSITEYQQLDTEKIAEENEELFNKLGEEDLIDLEEFFDKNEKNNNNKYI